MSKPGLNGKYLSTIDRRLRPKETSQMSPTADLAHHFERGATKVQSCRSQGYSLISWHFHRLDLTSFFSFTLLYILYRLHKEDYWRCVPGNTNLYTVWHLHRSKVCAPLTHTNSIYSNIVDQMEENNFLIRNKLRKKSRLWFLCILLFFVFYFDRALILCFEKWCKSLFWLVDCEASYRCLKDEQRWKFWSDYRSVKLPL